MAIPYEQQETYVVGTLTWAGVGGVGMLAAAALSCVIAALIVRGRGANGGQFWLGAGVVLLVLLAYRAAGLEHRIADHLRALWRDEGWYDRRRLPQAVGTILLILATIATSGILARSSRRKSRAIAKLAVSGLCALYAMRLLSLHLVDRFLYTGIGPIRMNWLLEVTLLGTVVVCAWRASHDSRSMRQG